MRSIIEVVLFAVVFGMVVVAMASIGQNDTQANVARIILDLNQQNANAMSVTSR